jgi:hypothetical protein
MTTTSDFITVVTSRDRRQVKLITGDPAKPEVKGHQPCDFYDMQKNDIQDLDALHNLLTRLLPCPRSFVLRGLPIEGDVSLNIARNPKTLRELPHHWLALDMDSFPYDGDWADLQACSDKALTFLPREFHACNHIVQATSSHGIKKDGARLRMWFWLSRPLWAVELRAWLKDVPKVASDSSVFSMNQPIFTATPVFDEGHEEHLPERMLYIDYGDEAVQVPAIEPKLIERKSSNSSAEGSWSVEDIREALERIDADKADYFKVLASTYVASGGGSDGFDAVEDWAATGSKYTPSKYEEHKARWDRFESSPPTYLHACSLRYMAQETDSSWRPSFERPQFDAEVEPLPPDATTDIEADVEAALAEPPVKRPRFRLLSIDDMVAMPKAKWVVKDMIPEKGLVAVFGPPKSGKTFVVLSIALHVAAGRWWCGHEVTQGGVVYIAGEGHSGLQVRIAAMRQEYKLDSTIPFWTIAQIVNFGNADQVDELAANIREAVGDAPISLVVIDTLARAMPGADENSSTEMGKVIANCDRLKEILGCTVMPIHHEGKDGTRGMRGSNSLDGAVDAAFKVAWVKSEAASILTLTTYYQKECEEAMPKFFDMTSVQVGEDIKSVVPILRTTPPPGKHDGITGHAGIAFSALEEALEDMGQELPRDEEEKLPFARGVREEDWRKIFCSRLPGDTLDSKKKSFSRQVTALLAKKIIDVWSGWVWRPQDIHEFGVEPQPLDEREEWEALMS